MTLEDNITETEKKMSKITGIPPIQYVFEEKYNPMSYYTALIECGIPKILAKIEAIQYEKHYNDIIRYFKITQEMKNGK